MSQVMTRGTFGTRAGFIVNVGAWNPAGAPPVGMPAGAINLADYGAVAALEIDSAAFPVGWVESYAVETLTTPFGPNDITIDFGTPAAPTLFTGAVAPGTIAGSLQYPPSTLETLLRFTIHATVGTLADLTAGQAVLALYVGRWPAAIGRT